MPLSESEWYLKKLKESKWSGHCSLRDIFGNLMVCSDQVQLRRYSGTLQGRGEMVDVWDRVPVWHCGSVKGPIVTTGSPVARSLLGDHMKG